MSKTITLRLNESVYDLFRSHASSDNRSLSNFIETSALRYISEHDKVDEFETAEIENNKPLLSSLKRGHKDSANKKGKFA